MKPCSSQAVKYVADYCKIQILHFSFAYSIVKTLFIYTHNVSCGCVFFRAFSVLETEPIILGPEVYVKLNG